MPSPFPGMDPFLEHPAYFPDLHDSLITYIREYLQERLPAPYYSVEGETEGGVGLATQTKPIVITIPREEIREISVSIFSRHDEQERLVTTIEILSPTNKTPGLPGRESYLRKQREILAAQVNLVEIDLLRSGEPTMAVPIAIAQERAGPFDFHVCIHRFDRLEDLFVYPILLTEKLPAFAIPLLPGDPGVPLDLQAVFNRAYDTGPYRRRVRYQEELLTPPIRPNLAEWLRSTLASPKG